MLRGCAPGRGSDRSRAREAGLRGRRLARPVRERPTLRGVIPAQRGALPRLRHRAGRSLRGPTGARRSRSRPGGGAAGASVQGRRDGGPPAVRAARVRGVGRTGGARPFVPAWGASAYHSVRLRGRHRSKICSRTCTSRAGARRSQALLGRRRRGGEAAPARRALVGRPSGRELIAVPQAPALAGP